MKKFNITYKVGLEDRGQQLSDELDRLEREQDGLRFWQFVKKRANRKALERALAEHYYAIDLAVTLPDWSECVRGRADDDHGRPQVVLSEQPDGFGFLYGAAWLGDAVVQVNVLPPSSLWRGDVKLDDHPPDPTKWIVYADGEEIARVKRREDLVGALVPLLTNG